MSPVEVGVEIVWRVGATGPNLRRKCHLKSCGKRPVVWKRTARFRGVVVVTTFWCADHPPEGAAT